MIGTSRRHNIEKSKFIKSLDAPNLKWKQKQDLEMQCSSNSSRSKRDSDSSLNLGFSTELRSVTSSTRANSPSCIINCWYGYEDDDIEDALACPLTNENMAFSSKDESGVEVIANGTKLMANILFPTVIIMTENMKLYDSTLYYLNIEAQSGPYVEKIMCLMFSSPYNSERTLQTAELLPLRGGKPNGCSDGVQLIPMLLDNSYGAIFEIGCKFTVNSIEQGRPLNLKGRKWKDYDMAKSEIHLLLRRLLYLDINQIPMRMLNSSKSCLEVELLSRNYLTVNKEYYSPQKLWVDFPNGKPDKSNKSVIPRRRRKRRSSFAKFLNSLPTHNHLSKDGENDHAIKLSNDKAENIIELDEYVSLSVTI